MGILVGQLKMFFILLRLFQEIKLNNYDSYFNITGFIFLFKMPKNLKKFLKIFVKKIICPSQDITSNKFFRTRPINFLRKNSLNLFFELLKAKI